MTAGGSRTSRSGPADGLLVLYLHGAIGSPQCVDAGARGAHARPRIRYVMVSRPGFGGSDPAPGRTLRSFAADAGALADHLGQSRFAVVGVSAGGPYALACAHELPRAACSRRHSSAAWRRAAVPQPDCPARRRFGLRSCAHGPQRAGAPATPSSGWPAVTAAVAGRLLTLRTPARGNELPERPAARFLAAASGGVGGMIDDYLVSTAPWGFRPAVVRGPVQLWHGMRDPLVPVDQAMYLAAELPQVQAALHPDEGHFFYRRRLREILGDLVAAAAATPTAAADAPAARVRPRA